MRVTPFTKEITDDFFKQKEELQKAIIKNPLSPNIPDLVTNIGESYKLVMALYEWAPPNGRKYIQLRNKYVDEGFNY